eukprot:scaffold28138_cov28-Tisochrysis_lutea.AAC.2
METDATTLERSRAQRLGFIRHTKLCSATGRCLTASDHGGKIKGPACSPCSSKSWTSSTDDRLAARWMGAGPPPACSALGRAPCCRRSSAAARCPWRTARASGETPAALGESATPRGPPDEASGWADQVSGTLRIEDRFDFQRWQGGRGLSRQALFETDLSKSLDAWNRPMCRKWVSLQSRKERWAK